MIKYFSACTGCEVCVSMCPKSCIQMKEMHNGFLYPVVNEEKCIHCGICIKRCPVNTGNIVNEEETSFYAVINPDDKIRFDSSSGGIFTMMAESYLERGGGSIWRNV